jgi:biotin operon repressor
MSLNKKYKKISEKNVVDIILRTAQNWQSCGIISPSNISCLLETSRYQVNKHIKSLKNKGLIVYKSLLFGNEEDYYPVIVYLI